MPATRTFLVVRKTIRCAKQNNAEKPVGIATELAPIKYTTMKTDANPMKLYKENVKFTSIFAFSYGDVVEVNRSPIKNDFIPFIRISSCLDTNIKKKYRTFCW